MFCPECGGKVKEEAEFCPNCGKQIKGIKFFRPTKKILFLLLFIVLACALGGVFWGYRHFLLKSAGISHPVKAHETTEVSFQQATLTLPKESLKKDTQITIKTAIKPPSLPSKDAQYVGQVYEFGPSKTKFDQPGVITLKYELSDLPDPSWEDSLYLATWEDNKWKPLEGTMIDKTNHTVSATVEHFSLIALIRDKVNLVVGSGKIEKVSYDNLPSQIRNPLAEEGYGPNEVWVIQRIEFPTGLKLASLVLVFANNLSKVTGMAIGGTQSKEELIKATAETVGKEIVKAQGKEGQLLVTAYKVGKGGVLIDKLASSGIAIAQGVKDVAELELIYAKAVAWILTAEMDYINQHLEEPYKLLWKLNPGEGKQLEVYHVVVAVPGKEGIQERRGEKWYYLNQATQKYENFYDSLAGSTLEFKPTGAKEKTGEEKNVASSANGGKATADSYGSYGGYTALPEKGNDDNKDTFWAGTDTPGWYQVEFDKVYPIDKIVVKTYYLTQTFYIELSKDGTSWNKVVPSTRTKDEKPSGEGENDSKEFTISPTEAKYIKVTITESDAPASYIYQTALLELEAYTSGEGKSAEITPVLNERDFDFTKTSSLDPFFKEVTLGGSTSLGKDGLLVSSDLYTGAFIRTTEALPHTYVVESKIRNSAIFQVNLFADSWGGIVGDAESNDPHIKLQFHVDNFASLPISSLVYYSPSGKRMPWTGDKWVESESLKQEPDLLAGKRGEYIIVGFKKTKDQYTAYLKTETGQILTEVSIPIASVRNGQSRDFWEFGDSYTDYLYGVHTWMKSFKLKE